MIRNGSHNGYFRLCLLSVPYLLDEELDGLITGHHENFGTEYDQRQMKE